jgi:hypothetical protein
MAGGERMKVFLFSIAFAVVGGVVGEAALTGFAKTSAEQAFSSSTARP